MTSRIPGFYRLSPEVRLERIALARDLSPTQREAFLPSGGLGVALAAELVENVIGVHALPLGIGLNLLINQRDYLVPMVVEEPSVVAAVSHMARLTRDAGGLSADADPSVMIGQIQLLDVSDPGQARLRLQAEKAALLEAGNAIHPRLLERGGGLRDLELREVCFEEGGVRVPMLVVHLLVDTVDAMGANLVNTLVEELAPRVADICGGRTGLKILSNLADRRLARASVRLPLALLEDDGFSGEEVLAGMINADRFAMADPYRAATHNKGIMNGIDAVALATGNDWRGIEAGAHAYAARTGRYLPLSRWRRGEDGALEGRLELPLAVGLVGGAAGVHPTIQASLQVLGVGSARELAGVMAAVGLVQNLAALRALATEGIQRGHMSLHARAVAMAAGVPSEWVPEAVNRMVRAHRIHLAGARDAYASLLAAESGTQLEGLLGLGVGYGKVILLGEHAVVYGQPGLAGALEQRVQVAVRARPGPVWVAIPELATESYLFDGQHSALKVALRKAFSLLNAPEEGLELRISGSLPPGKGLGSSAALAVAALRAVAQACGRTLESQEVQSLGLEVEQVFHGNPSGIDHAVAARGGLLMFRRGPPLQAEAVVSPVSIPLVLLDSGEIGRTATLVARVAARRETHLEEVDGLVAGIGKLVIDGRQALEAGELQALGRIMTENHKLLQQLQVSTPKVDGLVALALSAGAAGAKLTGAGGGGMVVALCPQGPEAVLQAAGKAGVVAFAATLGGERA